MENLLIYKNSRVSPINEIDKNVIDNHLDERQQVLKNTSTGYDEGQNGSSTDDYTDNEDYNSVP